MILPGGSVQSYRPPQTRSLASAAGRSGVRGLTLSWSGLRIAAPLVLAIVLLAGIGVRLSAQRCAHMEERLRRLALQRRELGDANIELLARRARLLSRPEITAAAARRLELFPPAKGQVHRF